MTCHVGGVGKGNSRPPSLIVTNAAVVNIGGDLGLLSDADLLVDSSTPLTLGGSFVNHSQDAVLFDWLGGAITLTGAAQFEVAGQDVGAAAAGFVDNFAMGTVTVAAGVIFSDPFDNDGQGQGACTEALYVDTLVFEPGASVTVDDCRIYVQTLMDNGVTPTLVGCGQVVEFSSALPLFPPRSEPYGPGTCAIDADCANSATCIDGQCYAPKNRYISIEYHPLNAGRLTARRISLDINGNGAYDTGVDVVLGWVDAPTTVDVTGPEPPVQLIARVVPDPVYMDWSTAGPGTVHLGDCHISPGHTYLVQSVEQGADAADEANYTAALALPTVSVWGDVTGGGNPAEPPEDAANFGDILAIVLGFQNAQTAPKLWLDLEGQGVPDNVPDFGTINFADILRGVQGFQAAAYPYSDPCTCAGLAACP